ncbi:MAG: eukaryotic translation initiation factor 4E [Chrysothrix sp. TS-e1954]|nr:MAG: eukaryotic translation initiation factor 4E [Chrysothrix sp. TS-e1954]
MATAVLPTSPVPLDTIPISPEDGSGETQNASDVPPGNGEAVTVFHDPDNFTVKHPLASKWTLWFTKPPSGKGDNWNELLKEVIKFDSVEEFWGVYNNITPTSQLPVKADYHLFKEGIRPEWEDPQNKHGGKWAYTTKEKKGIPIDELWLHVMLAGIGETLEDDDDGEVMGVVCNVRKTFYRIGLWTRTVGKPIPGGGDGNTAGGKGRSTDAGKEVLTRIGKKFKEALQLPDGEMVEFTGHTEAAHAGSSRARAKITA